MLSISHVKGCSISFHIYIYIYPEPHNQQHQEALNIWCKARQLGVSEMEEQQVIIDQLMKMEERDRLEAEKRGVSTRFNEYFFI